MPQLDPRSRTDASIIEWRAERLRLAGLGPCTAARVAADAGFDLHELLALIDRGCPPAVAVRILAPLDSPLR